MCVRVCIRRFQTKLIEKHMAARERSDRKINKGGLLQRVCIAFSLSLFRARACFDTRCIFICARIVDRSDIRGDRMNNEFGNSILLSHPYI